MPKKWNRFLPALVLLALALSSFVLHKFYVSHYTLEYRDHSLQCTVKIFTDDLEKALREKNADLRIDERQDKTALGKHIHTYLQEHFSIQVNGVARTLNWVGYELDNDLVWVYMEIPALKLAPHTLSIHCNSLTELFSDQVNIFRVDCGSLEETFSLNKKKQDHQLGLSD